MTLHNNQQNDGRKMLKNEMSALLGLCCFTGRQRLESSRCLLPLNPNHSVDKNRRQHSDTVAAFLPPLHSVTVGDESIAEYSTMPDALLYKFQ